MNKGQAVYVTRIEETEKHKKAVGWCLEDKGEGYIPSQCVRVM
jgi:hypothetical protein